MCGFLLNNYIRGQDVINLVAFAQRNLKTSPSHGEQILYMCKRLKSNAHTWWKLCFMSAQDDIETVELD